MQKQSCSPVCSIVPIMVRSCTIAQPIISRSDKISLSVPLIAKTMINANLTISEQSFLEDMVWMYMEKVISYILRFESYFHATVQKNMRMENKEKIQA